jgi:hypothetical protein
MMLVFLVSQLRDLQTHFSLHSHSILGLLPAADTIPDELSLALIGPIDVVVNWDDGGRIRRHQPWLKKV